MATCLSCKDLHVSFKFPDYSAKAVRGVSFDIADKTTLGIVGESGCGKTMTALSLMRLIPEPFGAIDQGEIVFENKDILKMSPAELRKLRGGRISMIFQDPMTSLNPVYTCGFQIRETLEHHKSLPKNEINGKVLSLLEEVGITEPQRTVYSYPHQLSGGMRQRVMIAMALSCSPRLLIADEPTTALDVTVQAKILDLLHSLQSTKSMSMVLISHNLGIVGDLANEVMVMYGGEIMEFASAKNIFDSPSHPYTKSLLNTIPNIDIKKNRLEVIPGEVPTLRNMPAGCPFHPRCKQVADRCKKEHPSLYNISNEHMVRCFLYEK